MGQKDNYFSVFNYINSKLEKDEISDTAVVCMNQDCKNEPYIEINYINEDDVQASLTTNYENLYLIESCAETYSDTFDVFEDYDNVMSVIYDTETEQLNLVKIRNGNCIGKKLKEDFEGTPIFMGYVINPTANLSYEEKIALLYEIMKEIMHNAYNNDLESSITFKVKEEVINNIYTIRTWKNGYYSNDNEETTDQQNYKIVESVFDVKFNEENIQKVKK